MQNFRGDVIGISNSSGTVIQSYTYDAFGNEENPSATDTNPFRYASQYWDNASGTYYLRARTYNPTIGRFTQEDTHWDISNMIYGDKQWGEDEIPVPDITAIAQSGNLYVYTMNNPVMYADPSGNEILTITFGGVSILIVSTVTMVWLLTPEGQEAMKGVSDAISKNTMSIWEGVSQLAKFAKQSKKSGKEKANDAPSWAKQQKPDPGEDSKGFATRILDEKYGKGKWKTGANSEFNKIVKWAVRTLGLK